MTFGSGRPPIFVRLCTTKAAMNRRTPKTRYRSPLRQQRPESRLFEVVVARERVANSALLHHDK
jgi:hypothetical protein